MSKRKDDPKKFCSACRRAMPRKRVQGRLEDRSVFLRRVYCDRRCMAKGQIRQQVKRGTLHWRARKFRKDQCEKCASTVSLSLHHVNKNPEDNQPNNRMTLCGSCHTRWHWEHGRVIQKQKRFCEACEEPARKLKLCQKHYQRFKKYGSPYLTKRRDGQSYVLVTDLGMKSGLTNQGLSRNRRPKESIASDVSETRLCPRSPNGSEDE